MKLLEKIKTDLVVDSRDRYKEAVLSLLEIDESAVLLDAGCGDSRRLTRKVMEKVGIQGAFGADLESTRESGLSIVGCDLNGKMPFGDMRFDVVVAAQIIEHLCNTDNFVKEVYRVLKPGGYAIVSTPNLASWHNIFSLLFGRQPETATVSDELYPWKEQPGHRRVFTAIELIKLLEFHDFIVERIIGTSYYPFTGRLASRLAKVDWKHAGNITVKVRKRDRP